MLFDTNKNKGKAGLSMAIAYYGSNGYTVLLPLDDTQDYDLVVEKDNIFQKVQVKATGYYRGTNLNRIVSLRNTGGTRGEVYGRVIESSADILFVLTDEKRIFEYKVKDLNQGSTLNLNDAYEIFI